MNFEKEIEILRKMAQEKVKEQLVRVYDWKTKEVTHHTLGIRYNNPDNQYGQFCLLFHQTNGEILEIENEFYLPEALCKLRKILETHNKIIVVRGADRDCVASGMQADMSNGLSISKLPYFSLTFDEAIQYSYYILADSKIENVTTIVEQEKYIADFYANKLYKDNENMKTVWKYELKMEASQVVEMPMGAKILSVGVIKNIAYLWAEVELSKATRLEKVNILTVPTGATYQNKAEFIGTIFYNEGEITQHVFRVLH
jgi:hypothetical protein